MVKCIRFFVLWMIIACTACNDSGPEHKTETTAASATATTPDGTPGDFYKRLSGSVAGRNVVMHLEKFGPKVQGYYTYTDENKPVMLVNWSDTTDDQSIRLTEVEGDGDAQDITGATWDLTLNGGEVTGKWISADGKSTSDIALKEDYPDGSVQLSAFYYHDSAQMFRTLEYPRATVSYGGLFPATGDKSEAAAFLRSAIATHMTLEGGMGMMKGFQTRSWRYFGNYRLDLKTLIDTNASELKRKSMAYQYSSTFHHNVLWNDRQWLILEESISDYTGGAHGTYTSTYQNLDLANSRIWRLPMMVNDSSALRPLLTAAARDYFKIPAGEKLDSRLLVPDVPVTSNVYLTPAGLFFVYQPYEIASYADGLIRLFIPYDKLQPLLTTAFANRMQLGDHNGVALR